MNRVICVLLGCLMTGGPAGASQPLTQVSAEGLRAVLDRSAGQVVLVNFWATWCGPCLKEIPVLMELQAELANERFVLIPVSLDEPGSGEVLVTPFMDRHFPGFTSYITQEWDRDDLVSVIDNGWNGVLPTTYLLNRDGSVAQRLQGKFTKAQFLAAINPLIDKSPLQQPSRPGEDEE